MKAKINYKSKKTIIIAIIVLALIIISGIAIGMFIKANDSSEAVGGNNTISDNNDSNANKNEVSQNQTGEANGETAGNAGEGENQTNPDGQENANNANNQGNVNNQGNNAGNANNNGANVPETEYIVGRTEIIPERVISENYYVSWVPTQFGATVKGSLNKSNITAVKTVAKVTANGLVQNPQSVKVGEILQYTITLTNNHEKINGVVTVKDIIPEGTEFVSATEEKLTTMPAQYDDAAEVTELTWKNVKVEANTAVNLVVYVKVLKTVENEAITAVQNKATITEGTKNEEIESPETKVANITSQKTSKVIYNEQKPHEHIVVDGIEPLHEQDIIEYTITLINSGEAVGTVKVTDTVPEGTTLVPNSKVTVIDQNGVSTYEMSELVEGIDVTVNSATEGEEGTSRILGTATVTFKVIVNTFAEETKTIKNDMAKVDGNSTNTTEDEAEKVYIDITATKSWENIENDAAKQYAVQDILLVLSANDKEIEEKQANAENNWTVNFVKQPKYENNEEIIYTVAEKALDEEKQKILDEHYNAETSVEKEITSIKITITNTFDPSKVTDTVNVPAKKVWENIESDAAKVYEVTSIKLQVLGNNELVKEQVVAEKADVEKGIAGGWSYTFTNLPKYDANGNEIAYTVAEAAVNKDDEAKLEKYVQNIDQETRTITNTFDPSKVTDTVNVPAKKVWENMESDAAKVYTVESIKLQVLGNNEFVKEEVVTAKESWECVFKDLPKYDANGNEITYTVAEAAVSKEDEAKLGKYTQNIDQETGAITNTFDPSKVTDTVDVPAKKVWENMESDAAKVYEVTSIKLQVLGNNEFVKEQVVAEKADEEKGIAGGWNYTFTNLPKYDANGNEIVYTVAEAAVNKDDEEKLTKYTQSIDQETGAITNTFDLSTLTDTVDVPAKKAWENMGSDAAKVYEVTSIKLQVFGNNEFVKEEVVTAEDSWECLFENLPKYDANGNEIVYTVAEAAVNKDDEEKLTKYTQSIDQETGAITNTFDLSTLTDTVDVPAKKVWENMESDAAEVYAVTSIKLQVFGNNEFVKEQIVTAEGSWEYLFEDLPKYDANGNEITYTVAEVAVSKEEEAKLGKYTQNIDQETGIITNTFDPSTLTDTVNVPAKKVWENMESDAAEVYAVTSIKLQVFGNNEFVKEQVVTAEGSWEYLFEDLPKYDANGNEIAYTVAEAAVNEEDEAKLEKYTQNIDQETRTITNIFDPSKVTDKTSIKAEKVWKDNGSAAAEAYKMQSITFEARIYAKDGTYTVTQSKEVKADANGKWKVTFEDLAKYDENGNEIVYVIDEVVTNLEDQAKLDVYNKEISTLEDGTKVITNTFDSSKVTDTIEIKAQKIWLNNGSAAANEYKMSSIKFEVRVYAEDGTYTVVQSKEVKADANGEWKVTFEDLAKYDANGNEIVYVIDEVVADSKDQYKLDAYEQEKATAQDGTKVIINTFNPSKATDKTSIKAEKVWKDNGSAAAEAYKMQSITFEARIYAKDGTYAVAQSKEVKADANGKWKVTFEDLAKYDANGNEIVYVIDEVVTNPEDQAKLDVYNKETTTAEDGTKVITNTFEPSKVTDKTSIKAEKVWKDNGSAAAEAYKMQSITFEAKIYAENGTYTVVQSKEVKADANGKWKVTFEDLAKYDANGNEIVYVIDEVVTNPEDQAKLDVYNKEISTSEDGTKVITNTFDPSKVTDTTEIKAEKVWEDNGSAAAEAYKMQSITFEARIYAQNGTYTVVQSKEVKADANGKWKVTFEDLAKYDANGNEIVYVIDEVVTNPEDQAKLDVYNKEISTSEDGTKVITNTFDPSKVTDSAEVTITKIWEDNLNKYNTRPDNVTIKLSNGTNYVLTGAENAESWTKIISLPKYDNQGNLITYTATEENVPAGYTKVSEEGTTVTNRANVIVEKSAYKANEDGTIGNEVSSSDEFKANDTVYYKLTFKNAGNSVIETKTLTDTLSLRLELVAINETAITEETVNGTDSDGYAWTLSENEEGNTVINWTLTNVPAGAQKELIIKAKVSEEAEYKDLCHIDGDETDYTAKLYVRKADNSYTNSLGTVYLNSVDLSNVLETLPSNDLYYVLKNNNAIVDLVSKGISRDTLKTALADNGITLAKDEVVLWYAIKNENSEYHIYGEVRKTANLTVINNEVYMDNIKQDDVTIDLEDIEIGQSGTVTIKGVSTSTESVSTPMDIVFIIDTSGSMQGNNATNMKNAVNSTIRTLMDKNENNRIAVVGFSGNSSQTITNSSTIIPLGTYGKNKDYLTLDNNTIYSNVTTNSSRQIVGGTNTQAGIKAGADILTAQSLDRTFTATVNGVSVKGTRTPVLVLVTDGDPTYYYANETATGTRNGNGMAGSTNENYYYWTIRTAKYYKDQVTSKYYGTTGKQAKMFTIGIGIGAEGDYLAKALLDPDTTNVGNCNDNTKIDYEGTRYEQDNRSTKKKLYDLLLNSNTDKNPYAYDYADGSKSGALTESDIQTFLNSSLSASLESFNVRNITVEEAKARRIDLTNIDTAKEFLLTIAPEEGEKIELNSLEEAKTTNNGEYGAYVKVDSTTGGLYVDLTGIDRTSTVNVTYWEQQTQAN